jgi:hypothetical protein
MALVPLAFGHLWPVVNPFESHGDGIAKRACAETYLVLDYSDTSHVEKKENKPSGTGSSDMIN